MPMQRVGVVTDSVACISKEVAEAHRIVVVPINLIVEGRTYRDGVDASPSQFYTLLDQAKGPVSTSAPAPGMFLEAYRKVSTYAESVLCITLSAKLSGIYNAASAARLLAREETPQLIVEVFDSRLAAMAQGFVALAAAKAALRGETLNRAMEVADSVSRRVEALGILDTLRYLVQSGRIPKAAGWAGSRLNLKPILHIANGEVGLYAVVKNKARGIDYLFEAMGRATAGGKLLHAAVMHANVPDEAEALRREIAERFPCIELYVTEFTPAMGAMTGPGLLAAAFYAEEADSGA